MLEAETSQSCEPDGPAKAAACEKMVVSLQVLTAHNTGLVALQAMLDIC
jgi:hypothetical protein